MQRTSNWFTTRPAPKPSGAKATAAPATAGSAFKTFFLHRSSITLSLLTISFAVGKLFAGNWHWADLIASLMIFAAWPVLEWAIHVILLHNKPHQVAGRNVDFLLPQTHRWHHADPWNLHWVFIPPHIIPLVAPLLIATILLTVPIALGCTILAVYFALALHYEWVHYLSHINWCPPLAYYQRRVREHRLHHFKSEKHWWGVSMGLGDRFFNTAPHAADAPTSDTTGNIIGTPR